YVLANIHADPHAVDFEHARTAVGIEITFFIEYSVVRQIELVIDRRDAPILQYRSGVVEIGADLVRVTDHDADALDLRRQRSQRAIARRTKIFAQEQILRRI